MNISQVLGSVGTGLVIAGYIPQLHHVIKERCTAGLSVPAFAVWCSASLLFLIHATMIRDLVFVGGQVVNLAAGGIIVALCRRYDGQVCPSHAARSVTVSQVADIKPGDLVAVDVEGTRIAVANAS